jgi:hypothetical protein
MSSIRPRYSKEEFARKGDLIYDRDVLPSVGAGHEGEFAAIDIETGEYEVDVDEREASGRLRARHPNAQIWLRRIGRRYTRKFGSQRQRQTK